MCNHRFIRAAQAQIRRAHRSEDGAAMPIVLFFLVMTLAISIAVLSVLTWQMSQNTNARTEQGITSNMDAAIAQAAETVGISGQSLLNVPLIEPESWSTAIDGKAATRWWALPLDNPDPVIVTQPTNIAFATSDGARTLAIGFNGKVYASVNGQSWTRIGTSPVDAGDISQVTFLRDRYVIAARPDSSANAFLYVSTSGANWTAVNALGSPDSGSAEDLTRVACAPTVCVLIVTDRSNQTRYFSAPDLFNWTLRVNTQDQGSNVAVAEDLAYGNNRFVTVGYKQGNKSSVSIDGLTWGDALSLGNAPSSLRINRIVFADGIFVTAATGTNGTAYPGLTNGVPYTAANDQYFTTGDGVTWTSRTFPVQGHWTDLRSNGMYFIVVAESLSTEVVEGTGPGTSTFLTSTSGTSWSQRTLPAAHNWIGVAQVGQAWLFYDPYVQEGFIASSLPGRPALARNIIVVSEVKTSAKENARTVRQGLSYRWNDETARWELVATYNNLSILPTVP
jgi:hypothetical protein